MNYLSGLLKGEAAKVIQGLPLSESNYKRAVDLLKERFGQKQVLINAHMDALLKIPAATNDVKKLRSLYDACEGYIHGLESLHVYPESYGDLLIPIVMKKLPDEVRRIMLRSHDETTWTLAYLRKQLRHEVETREKSSLGQSDKEVSVPNPLSIPSSLLLVLCSLVPWEERTARMTVRFVMGPTPRTRVRSSQQLTRDSNFSATRKGASGALRQVICQSPATRRSVVRGTMENIVQRCVNQLELTGINLLEQFQPKKIQVGEIPRKKIPPSQKDLHLLARRILLRTPSYYSQHLWTLPQVREVAKHAYYLTVDHSARLSLKIWPTRLELNHSRKKNY